MTKQEYKALRGRYRRAVRDTWLSAEELTHGLLYIPDNAMECYNRAGQLLQEYAAAIGRPNMYPSRVLSYTLNADKWIGGVNHE